MGGRARTLAGLVVIGSLMTPGAAHGDMAAVTRAVTAPDPGRTIYSARDDRGTSLDCLDVVQDGPRRYLGVHQALVGGRFEVHVVSSEDLRHWTFRRVLAHDAGMPAIAPVPGGGYVVADERASTLGILPSLTLPTAVSDPTHLWLLQKSQLRFRFYSSAARLLEGRPARSTIAPRTISPTNEGTPSITVTRMGRGVAGMRVEAGFHAFVDLDSDGLPDADRQATGTLTGMRTWRARRRPDLDAQVLRAAPHPGYATSPTGSIGDRDDVVLLDGTRATLTEAQYSVHDVSTWRLFLRHPTGGPATPLSPVTPGGSRAFGNPSLTVLTDPEGRPALLFSAFVFAPGSGPGEAGELVSVSAL